MGVDVDWQNPNHRYHTALIYAADQDHVAVVELLLSANANPNPVTKGEYTALYEAATRGHVAVVKLLVAANAQINYHDGDGKTPLWGAAHNGRLDVVRALLNAGADKTIADNHGKKPIDVVCIGLGANKQHKAAIDALIRWR